MVKGAPDIINIPLHHVWHPPLSIILIFKRGSHSHDCRGDHRRPKQSSVVAWKSPVKSAKIEFYNHSTTESTTTYVDTRPTHDIVVRRLWNTHKQCRLYPRPQSIMHTTEATESTTSYNVIQLTYNYVQLCSAFSTTDRLLFSVHNINQWELD